jgi:hypothetical protein
MNATVAQNWDWLFVGLILILILIWRPALSKGERGESAVNAGLARHLDQKVYRLIRNVTLPFGNDTTQIDHLVISTYGIFVIETKNMRGWIFGHPDDAQWTQVIYRSKQKFQNPLFQNYAHIKVVLGLLNIAPDHVHSVVVFVSHCTFKTPMPFGVVHGVRQLVDFIQEKRTPVFTENEVRLYADIILATRLKPGPRTDRVHVRSVKRRLSNKYRY